MKFKKKKKNMDKSPKQCQMKQSSWKKLYTFHVNFAKRENNAVYLWIGTYVIENIHVNDEYQNQDSGYL